MPHELLFGVDDAAWSGVAVLGKGGEGWHLYWVDPAWVEYTTEELMEIGSASAANARPEDIAAEVQHGALTAVALATVEVIDLEVQKVQQAARVEEDGLSLTIDTSAVRFYHPELDRWVVGVAQWFTVEAFKEDQTAQTEMAYFFPDESTCEIDTADILLGEKNNQILSSLTSTPSVGSQGSIPFMGHLSSGFTLSEPMSTCRAQMEEKIAAARARRSARYHECGKWVGATVIGAGAAALACCKAGGAVLTPLAPGISTAVGCAGGAIICAIPAIAGGWTAYDHCLDAANANYVSDIHLIRAEYLKCCSADDTCEEFMLP